MALLCLFIVCISAAARSDDAIDAEALNLTRSPAIVAYCSVGSYGIPGTLVFQADFIGTSDSPLTAVKLRFDLYDAFGTYLAGLETTRSGSFTAGARIQTSGRDPNGGPLGWKIRNHWPDTRRVNCSIAKTLAADGTVWTNPELKPPPPSPLP